MIGMEVSKGLQERIRNKPADQDGFWDGVRACVPTLLGYLSIGFAAGVVGKTAGLSMLEIALMSLLIYAGSAQFIATGMIVAATSPITIIVTIFFVNLRHLLLSAALAPYFRHLTPIRNMFIGALLTDETFGVAMNETVNKTSLGEKWMHGLNITAYLNWLFATIAGAFLGQWITNPEKFGLDFALAAMFIGLLVLQMTSRKKIVIDLIVAGSAVVTAVCVSSIYSTNIGVIVAIIVAATIGVVIEKWE